MASVANDHGGAVHGGVPDGHDEAAAQGEAKRGGDPTYDPKLLSDPCPNSERAID